MKLELTDRNLQRYHLTGTLVVVVGLALALAGSLLWIGLTEYRQITQRFEQAQQKRLHDRLQSEMDAAVGYLDFLQARTGMVLRKALQEKTAMAFQIATAIHQHEHGRHPEAAPIMKPAAPAGYKVDQDGNVTYYDQQRRAMFTDTGPAVEFSQTERDTLETGLRLALAKFGPSIRLRGGDEAYRHAMADIAADKGLYVEFSDKALQDRYSQRREATQAGRDYFTKSKGGGQQPERDQPEQAKQREREHQAQKPDHGRGR